MGEQYRLHCPKCGYETCVSLGIGFLYPMVYLETMKAAKKGKLGATLKKFLTEHPEGVINPGLTLAQCEKCGNYSSVNDYTMYLPKTNKRKECTKGKWSVGVHGEDASYVISFEDYDVYKLFPHRCGRSLEELPLVKEDGTPLIMSLPKGKRCRGKVKLLDNRDIEKLRCPNCKNRLLDAELIARWD